ncbi:MAG: glycoside hydrolase family 2 protein [Cytophagia bacterium]|nr:glycoside hydrolase family 2 protein [Cytophagia bacterium]
MKYLLVLLYSLQGIAALSQVEKVSLHQQWKFREVGKQEWLPASVPGTVHTDLLANKKIEDPFYGTNELALQWIDTLNWEYQSDFNYIPQEKNKKVYLNFEGLDTYATVYLNDVLLGKTDNMFRAWKFEVSRQLKTGKNTIKIAFESATKRGKAAAKKLNYILPGDEKVFTRKAAYHYGWDWGARFVTCGIWKPVSLEIEQANIIVDHHQFLTHTLTEKEAKASVKSTLHVYSPTTLKISVYNKTNQSLLGSSTHIVQRDTTLQTSVSISNPQLWWCNGYGEPHLYTLDVVVEELPVKQKQQQSIRVGLRTIALVQEEDSLGRSFYFKLNGKPIFSKGANYIPPDNFLPRVTKEKYQNMVERAKAANMNMLRVWGGGVYAEDAFYEACDEAGILVWQDFMFACSMYPGDEHFIRNVAQEATEQVIRLRNHACIALWCGNNEVSEAWHNWGWQKQYNINKTDSASIWHDYLSIFEKVLPNVVKEFDQPTAYWPSSPQHGWGRKQSLLEGDVHYWGVWWGMQPFSVYNEKIGRFMSEYGFQSMPSLQAYANITQEQDISLQSPIVKHHQKHPTGFETISTYLQQSYKTPKLFNDYVYVSQLLQGEGMKIAIEAHRRNQPYCMGTLYWQLNDSWPVASWSSLDYLDIPKASHYAIKRALSSCITSVLKKENQYQVYLITDHAGAFTLSLTLQKLNGEKIWEKSSQHKAGALTSLLVYQQDADQLLANYDPTELVLMATLTDETGKQADKNYFYFVEPKDLSLQKPSINYTIDFKNQSITIQNGAQHAKHVYLSVDSSTEFSTNYFDLASGESMRINFTTKNSFSQFKKKLQIKSLYETYEQ